MVRRTLYAAGAVLIGVGLAGIGRHVEVVGWAVWFAGVAVAHDAVFAPLVLGAAYVTRRACGGVAPRGRRRRYGHARRAARGARIR